MRKRYPESALSASNENSQVIDDEQTTKEERIFCLEEINDDQTTPPPIGAGVHGWRPQPRGAAQTQCGSEHGEDRNDRPQEGNLPLTTAGRWQCRAPGRVLAMKRGQGGGEGEPAGQRNKVPANLFALGASCRAIRPADDLCRMDRRLRGPGVRWVVRSLAHNPTGRMVWTDVATGARNERGGHRPRLTLRRCGAT